MRRLIAKNVNLRYNLLLIEIIMTFLITRIIGLIGVIFFCRKFRTKPLFFILKGLNLYYGKVMDVEPHEKQY